MVEQVSQAPSRDPQSQFRSRVAATDGNDVPNRQKYPEQPRLVQTFQRTQGYLEQSRISHFQNWRVDSFGRYHVAADYSTLLSIFVRFGSGSLDYPYSYESVTDKRSSGVTSR